MAGSTEALTSCSACGIAFPLGARFCPSCGKPLEPSMRQAAATLRQTVSSVADPLIGQVIADRYRILSMLGRGGMGVVYRVEHVHIGKLMAMKLLSGELASDAATLGRFQREAKAVSKLSHPNTVQIFDFGESARLAYLVMEYLPGRDLSTVIAEEGPLDFARVARIGAQIAASVDEAHQSGIIHRDIKPENVMVLDTREQSDFVKVLDFGIAKLRDVEEGVLATQKGHLIGTPFYMAPEQIRADAIDHRVDIYALGGLMYKALTGVTPFDGDTPMEVLTKHLNHPVVPPSARVPLLAIPPAADRILSRELAKEPAARHADMAELRDELTRYLESVGVEARAVHAAQLPGDTLATRDDVDRYERSLGRTLRIGAVLGALALGGLAVGGYAVWSRARSEARASEVEREPNDEPAQANLLAPGAPLKAQLGKRRSTTESDADVYRIEVAGDARVADIAVTALPNIDLLLELVEGGSSRPMLTVNTGGVGEPERIPNMTLASEAYYVRVREPVPPGKYPTENVSDSYTISLGLRPPLPDEEQEPNDSFEGAQRIAPGTTLRGQIGWAKDQDVFCAAADAAARVVTVSGVPKVDLVLAYVDRRTNAGQRSDRQGAGAGERLEVPRSSAPREVCFTVSARQHDDTLPANPGEHYQIKLQ